LDIAIKVLNQVIVVFLLIGVGFICTKAKMFTKDGIKQMTALLLNVVTPCVLINSYQEKDFTPELAMGLLWGALFTAISIGAMTILSMLLFKKEGSGKYKINRFASTYSNCGFMAIPLLGAALGADGVFYGSSYLAIFTLFYWTIGVFVFTEDFKDLSFVNIIKNPGVIGTIVSILLFLLRIKLPGVVLQPISFLAGLNTPVAMLILGSYMVDVKFSELVKEKGMYAVCLLRLLVFPLISLGIAMLLKIDTTVAQAVMISSACPTATVTTLFAARYNNNAEYSAQVVSVTTLLSIITIPLIMAVMGLVY